MDTSSAVARAGPGSSASTSSQSLNNSSSSTVAASSTSKVGPTSWMHTVSSFTRSTRIIWSSRDTRPSRTSAIPTEECFTSNFGFKLFCSMETQCGHWLQHPQTGVMPRPPFSSYPPVYPTPFLLPTRGIPHLSVASNDSLPPGVPSVADVGPTPTSSAASGQQVVGRRFRDADRTTFWNWECVHEFDANERSAVNEQLDAWTAHKTDTGVVYYYNAETG
ncbi:hypothetical protein Pint_22576 [Pistacia integerrima]|uniref:Uncharacterized protein n=1 Tax=Pistacia integerrima TaxID=434235 RepID=A0ACC0YHV9_9ROSI|nr:hypothetical protein Pint_22576 [Pistacia integerrima]